MALTNCGEERCLPVVAHDVDIRLEASILSWLCQEPEDIGGFVVINGLKNWSSSCVVRDLDSRVDVYAVLLQHRKDIDMPFFDCMMEDGASSVVLS